MDLAGTRAQGGFRPGEDVNSEPASPQGAEFTQAADAGGTDRDVLLGYQVFLGRDPESSFVIADAKTSPVGAFVRALMGSGEFQSAVLDRLAAGRPLPHENAGPAPTPEQVAWLFGLLRVPPRAEASLLAATGWAEWLRTLVAIPGLPTAPVRAAESGPQVEAAGAGFVLVTIEAPKAGERVQAGSLVQGQGWAIAPADIAEAAVHLDGKLLTHARYGLPRPDVARSFPHYRHVDHCGFSFRAEIPDGTPPAALLTVIVRTVDGQEGRKSVRLQAQAQASAAAPLRTQDAAEAAWPIRLAVEDAVVDAFRMLRVRGWAVSANPIRAINVTLGEAAMGEARHGLPRPDIASQHASYANAASSGFALVAQLADDLPEGPSFVRVQAVDAAGQARQTILPVILPPAVLPPAVEAATAGTVKCACERSSLDSEGTLDIEGWAVSAGGIASVDIELDGIWLGSAERGGASPAASARLPDSPDAARAGFAFRHALSRRPAGGVHRLAVTIVAEGGAKRVLELPVVTEAAVTAPAPGATPQLNLAALAAMQAAGPPVPDAPPAPAPEPAPAPAPAPRPAPAGMRLEVDQPALDGGAAREPVRGALTVAGWSAARPGIARIAVYCDAELLGQAHLGMRREDVGALFPEYKGSLLAGYAIVLPPGRLLEGPHTIRIVATAEADDATTPGTPAPQAPTMERSFTVEVERNDVLPPDGSIRTAVPPAEVAFGLRLLARQSVHPRFEIAVAGASASPDGLAALDATLRSLAGQVYEAWTLTAVLPDGLALKAARALPSAADPAGRVLLQKQGAAGRAAAGGRRAAPAPDPARPSFTMLLRAGDRLGADALLVLATEAAADPQTDFIYADELRVDPSQDRRQPFFKPEWSPDLLLSMNYVGRPWCASDALLARAGQSPASLAGSTDYAAVLALSEHAARITHVPRVLCERGEAGDSSDEERAALQAALARRGEAATVEPAAAPGTWRVRRQVTPSQAGRKQAGKRRPRGPVAGRISIIIPTCAAGGLIRTCLQTIRATSAPALAGGRDVEVVIVDNTPASQTETRAWLREAAEVVVDMPGAFNWSRFNNCGARAASGEYLLFLNDDIETQQPDWLEALLEHAQRPEVGVVGARLLYPDGTVQHAGQYLSDTHARHAFRFAAAASPGPFGLAGVAREVISVTGACQMVRASAFAELGGFEEAHSVVNNDLDFCLRSWRAGLRVVYTPHATLTHHELASRAALEDIYDEQRFAGAWRNRFLAGDPFRNPRQGLDADHYSPDPEPSVLLHAGRRGPAADTVRRILAVKLDHIGDFLTGLPALRSLKRRFPAAQIDLLTPTASAELARSEPSVSEIIVFDFFHARSGLGQKGVGEAEFAALAERLAPARYDIAVDLRMQPETRAVLPHTGAAFLAGYDHDNRFPFLDVALEWEGDHRLVFKRAHVSERLMQLVSALEDACRNEPMPPQAVRLAPRDVPALAALPEAFLARPIVCVHPGVGNVVRQWPTSNYAALIDLLAGAGLHVVLIGAPEEAAITEDVLRRVASQGAVESLVGRVKLAQLPDVMRACALFVGNNSGPQHLAAALGMPAIGIHSGVVDATEWAPLGSQAVAMRRRMICSPCYLEFASDCPRNLACLTGLRPQDVFAACKTMLGRDAGESSQR